MPSKKFWFQIAFLLAIIGVGLLGIYFSERLFNEPSHPIKLQNSGALLPGLQASSSKPDERRPVIHAGHNFTAGNGMEMVWVEPMKGWVGKYLVTQQEYEKVIGSNPSFFKGARRPVESVSWEDAVAYCETLTEQDRRSGLLPSNSCYSLPSDAQYDILVGDARLEDAVVSQGDSRSSTEEVGSKGANQYGLYDTRGNVWEWLQDWYRASMNSPELRVKYPGLSKLGRF